MRRVPTANGQAWGWEHNGWSYQALWLPGTDEVRLWYKTTEDAPWEFGHSRELSGLAPVLVAQAMYDYVTA